MPNDFWCILTLKLSSLPLAIGPFYVLDHRFYQTPVGAKVMASPQQVHGCGGDRSCGIGAYA